jgi:hypothetical protein
MYTGHTGHWWATKRQGQAIGFARENVSNETEILVSGVKVCKHWGMLAFKAEKG